VVVAVCARNDAAEAEQVAAVLLAAPEPPDAIAAMSDQQATGVVRAARAAGRVIPDDLAVTGWDDLPVATDLGLTTVRQSLRDQGAACARAALGQGQVSWSAPWSTVRRGSTRPSAPSGQRTDAGQAEGRGPTSRARRGGAAPEAPRR
jgi:DNA-binding LacI/PurR family transcriptional regulator